MSNARMIPGDWHPAPLPDNVVCGPEAYIETSYSFSRFRSTVPSAVTLGKAASAYLGTMFDLGPQAKVTAGDYALLNGVRFICDRQIDIGNHALLSWNVVIIDTYRFPFELEKRREVLSAVLSAGTYNLPSDPQAKPVFIGNNVWIGFDACILPGTHIGDGAIVASRSVVSGVVEPYTLVAGNPARFIRRLES